SSSRLTPNRQPMPQRPQSSCPHLPTVHRPFRRPVRRSSERRRKLRAKAEALPKPERPTPHAPRPTPHVFSGLCSDFSLYPPSPFGAHTAWPPSKNNSMISSNPPLLTPISHLPSSIFHLLSLTSSLRPDH